MKQTQPLSACCNSPTYTSSGCDDDILHGGKPCTCEVGTMYFICSKCSKPCDIATPELSSCCGEPIKTGIESSAIGCIKYRRCTRCDEDCDIATPPTSGDELENWEIEFEEFIIECAKDGGEEKFITKPYSFHDELKDFIRQLISAEREKILEACKLEKRSFIYALLPWNWSDKKIDGFTEGYNVAVNDLNAIREKIKNNI